MPKGVKTDAKTEQKIRKFIENGKHRWKEFADFPTYQRAYIRAFDKMLDAIHAAGRPTKWKSGGDVFLWWMEDPNVEGQVGLEDFPEVMP